MQRIRRPAASTANEGAGVVSPPSRNYDIYGIAHRCEGVGTQPKEGWGDLTLAPAPEKETESFD
jgi:hypothetical protein